MEMQCKVFFSNTTTQENAEKILRGYSSLIEVANFYKERQIGSQVLTWAVVTMPIEFASRVDSHVDVIRVELLSNFKQPCRNKCGGCDNC